MIVDSYEVVRDFASYSPVSMVLPRGAKALGVGFSNGRAWLYVEHAAPRAGEPQETERRTLHVVGQGGQVDPTWRWLGCVAQGSISWHAYEERGPDSGRAQPELAASAPAQPPVGR